DLDMEKIFINAYLNNVPSGIQKVKGTVVTYEDNRERTETLTMPVMWKVSKGKGATTYKAKLNEAAPLDDIKQLVNLDGPTTFFLLSLNPSKGGTWKVTTKTSFPKGPAGSDDDDEDSKEKDPVFIKGALENTSEVNDFLAENLFPDLRNRITPKTKSIYLKHIIHIDDIEIPDDPNLSFKEKRKLAKKRGRIVRRVTIDEDTFEETYNFLV
ncbi:MAG: hypothetical protein ACFFF4_06085, partial [Candidatus Thorarchaeota archaeon]